VLAEYLYVFGYETPADHAANQLGADQESLGFFRIFGGPEEDALKWGHELSRWYTDHLFGNDGERHWDSAGFACWIEHGPYEGLRDAAVAAPVAAIGEYPELERIRGVFGD
jgi:hypothetical protein